MAASAIAWVPFALRSDNRPIQWGQLAKLPATLYPETPEEALSTKVQNACDACIKSLVQEHERLRRREADLRATELRHSARVSQAANNVLGVELKFYAVVRLFKDLGVLEKDYDPSSLLNKPQQLSKESPTALGGEASVTEVEAIA